MARIPIIFIFLGTLASLVLAASPPTFCKCTCFAKSLIIELGKGHEPHAAPPAQSPSPSPSNSKDGKGGKEGRDLPLPRREQQQQQQTYHLEGKRTASSSCSQCNRAFCLSNNLPICKGAEEKDVVTMCFARDSRKDRLIVWTFILGTAGLLGWAGAKRALEYRERSKLPAGVGGGGLGSPSAGAGLRSSGRRGPAGGPASAGGSGGGGGDYMFVVGDDPAEGSASGLYAGR